MADAADDRRLGLGTLADGHAIAHHGELLQGVFEDDHGRLHRGLVTLPIDSLRSTAWIVLDESGNLGVEPPSREKALRAAQLALAHLGYPFLGGRLKIESDIPVGHGYGSSTADVIASMRAVAAALGARLLPSTSSRLAVAAEVASDAIAFETEALLFAQREGVVLEYFGGSLPPFVLVGFKGDAAAGVDTLELVPARYSPEEIQLFRVLRGMVGRSVRYQDARLLGQAATMSARISQRHLPKPYFDVVVDIAAHHHACGIQVAHSGSLFGLMLDAQSASRESIHTIIAALENRGFQDIGIFPINVEEGTHVL
ncbi:kinase [Aminobacter sp. NyZ550]|uniref:GHMP family kinase ATP-binding protein n=1 Tax=Aminobacter sp. NyZ550 TaxID=2979870 RepID=UPI0021D5C0F8|nr:kinase [Aminobacter sp. NyZ550]WAX94910.1 kinase [Aminobacter sp. NyZ550]